MAEREAMTQPELVDKFGRRVDYLRVSLTDRCDFRCVYCMAEEMTFMPRAQILTLEEIYRICSAFVSLGVKKIRLTGGEPLIRRNMLSLVARLGALQNLSNLVLTTNGSQLESMAPALRKKGIKRINISLDSLNPVKFRKLTRTGDLNRVLKGIDAALEQGFDNVKINAVILKGRNDDEILPLVEFVRSRGLDLTFIEEMPLGNISEHVRAEAFMPSAEVREVIATRYPLEPVEQSTGGPARYFRFEDEPGSETRSKLGFISPHSHNFCSQCNRVRLTAEGRLLLCLGNEHSVDLRQPLRDGCSDQELQQILIEAMDLKPEKHYFDLNEAPQIVRFMNMTGG
jgi:cyclic pyranopterin phosphate synthase